MSKALKPVKKTMMGLRQALFDEINGLRTGETNIQRAAIIHKLGTQIIECAKLEVNYGGQISVSAKQIPAKLG